MKIRENNLKRMNDTFLSTINEKESENISNEISKIKDNYENMLKQKELEYNNKINEINNEYEEIKNIYELSKNEHKSRCIEYDNKINI